MQSILKGIGIVAKIGAIASVFIAPIIDGILGYFKADEWGVSKMSGIIGGVLGGGEGGIFNMFMNAGKWAIMGAAAGTLIFPGVGTVIGGIAGAIVGAILGFFGGDKIAKLMDSIGAWFSDKWRSLKVALGFEDATKEEMAEEIAEEREELETALNILKKQREKARAETDFGKEGQRFESETQKDVFLSGLDVSAQKVMEEQETLDTNSREQKLLEKHLLIFL